MTEASAIPPVLRGPRGPGEWTAAVILVAGVLSAVLAPLVPWIAAWPAGWTLPVAEWVSAGLGAVLEAVKPGARVVSGLLGTVMRAVTWLLVETPWPAVFLAITTLGYRVGGAAMGALCVACLGFILASGYWEQSMRTLALVAVSVPLALSLGLGIGIAAYEIRWIRRTVEAVLDVMQTVPTFAYLTPLLVLFGFGPVVGLIASAIYAAPPMARNVLLGLDRVDAEIREAAAMLGTTRAQRLVQVELPAALGQILVGVNQCVMAALSMVIIAAVIGGSEDIGWEVVRAVQKAWLGPGLLAGFVIVLFAILIDRMSAALSRPVRGEGRVALILMGVALAAGVIDALTGLGDGLKAGVLQSYTRDVDEGLNALTRTYGTTLDTLKNGAMFYGMLPLRIGLDDAVLPFTWGFAWTPAMSVAFLGAGAAGGTLLVRRGWLAGGAALAVLCAIVHTGITHVPWPAVIVCAGALGWRAGGWGLAAFAAGALGAILLAGLWDRAMLSIYLCGAAVALCALAGGALGMLAALSPLVWRVLQPVCDTLQTIPLFVFLIPMLMFFQIGEFSALLAICAYAIVPMIRYTRHGLTSTPPELIEAAEASGATRWQILRDVRAPFAAPTMLLGLNQTILYAFAMLVIAALIGTTGLGQSIYIALGRADVGLGITAGAAMALLALVADRLVQGFAAEQRRALGL